MKKTIAVLPGDGIGPEIISQAVKVLDAVAERYSHEFIYRYADIGAAAIDSCGEPYPDTTHRICMESDAILFGAIGDPRYDSDPSAKVRPEQGLLKMRKSLGLYANIRPVRPYASLLDASPLKNDIVEGSDFVVVRELTGGIYFGEPRGRSEAGDRAFDTCVYSAGEIRRVAETAFGYARRRRGRVTLVDKANVLATSRLWREVVTAMQKTSFPDIALDCLYVDNAAMKMVSDPKSFDVILTENMFGDILSDVSGVINGSIGLLPSASFGSGKSLFEPIHGSFPQGAGKDIANPVATILSAAMMLEDAFGMKPEADAVRAACDDAVGNGICTPDIIPGSSHGTSAVGSYIASRVSAA
ncbi:MAG: 3-isopropylmalate dehydrogenase [Bacteroidetes bacterium]|uniref:3-isopropylmalate dehydrogenase n=1 Tax=Candidatus Cryptobacteroides intestinavium TaxID=2840766 RepID=A0A9D9EUA5_9BACT|nr:3-isopropylmalate dehydrogenase [Candidatus Cryptobacteroides intestinavium]